MAKSTIGGIHSILSGAFEAAMRWEWTDRNPAASARPGPRGRPARRRLPRAANRRIRNSERLKLAVHQAGISLFVPKPSRGADCQRCGTSDLGSIVRQRPLACSASDSFPLRSAAEGRFTQGVGLRVPRSEVVRGARGGPLVTTVFRPFWHGCGYRQWTPAHDSARGSWSCSEFEVSVRSSVSRRAIDSILGSR